jgi:hypothetical protein
MKILMRHFYVSTIVCFSLFINCENSPTPNNTPTAEAVVNVVDTTISSFKNIRLTAGSKNRLMDSCLLNCATGSVYQLTNGATKANKVDFILNFYSALAFFTPGSVVKCGPSCGVGQVNKIIVSQQWASYRLSDIEVYQTLEQNRKHFLPTANWSEIKSSKDIITSFKTAKLNKDPNDFLYATMTDIAQIPKKLYTEVLYRFVTQEGKKGLIRLKSFGQTGDGWYIVFDLKIQK